MSLDKEPRSPLREPLVLGLCGALSLATLIVDLATPRGFAAGVFPYFVVILLTSLTGGQSAPFFFAGVATLFSIVGYLFTAGGVGWIVLVNRAFIIAVLWITAVIVHQRKRAAAELQASRESLEQLVEERTGELDAGNAQLREEMAERKQAEALNTRLGRIIDQSTNEMFVFDAESLDCLLLNRAARENLGRTSDAESGLAWSDIDPDFQKEGRAALLQPLRDGRTPQALYEMERRGEDGILRSYEIRVQYLPGEEPPVFVAIAQDITERKGLEEQLRQAQKMEAIGQLTGGVAHDFNNLLTVLIGNLELLEDELLEGDRRRRLVKQALDASDMGAQLTERLLAFGRRQPFNAQIVDVNSVVVELADLLQRTLGEDVRINTVLGQGAPKVRSDASALQNALLNMAVNARDAMPRGGRLQIETASFLLKHGQTPPQAGMPAGNYARISISDSGCGIAPEIRGRIFDPFFTTKAPGVGTGLGLSMVFGFLKQSNGYIRVDSAPGVGTTMEVFLPDSGRTGEEPSADEAVFPAGATAPRGCGEKILVVEDNAGVRETTVGRLERLGYQVLQASEAASALTMLERETEIDLVLTDIIMAGPMNGLDLARTIRQRFTDVGLLFATGYADEKAGVEAIRSTGARVLRKPYRVDDLAQAVAKGLRQRGASRPKSGGDLCGGEQRRAKRPGT